MSPNTPLVGQVWPQGRPQASQKNRFRVSLGSGSYAQTGVAASLTSDQIPLDPYFNSVTLLLDMEGGGFTDRSTLNKSVTPLNGAVTSTDLPRYGSRSFYTPGTGHYLTVPSAGDFVFPGDFTVETWIWGSNSQVTSYPTVFEMGYYYNGLLFRPYHGGGGLWINSNNLGDFSSSDIPYEQWNHIAFVRSGTSFVCYVNGVVNKSATISGTINSIDGEIRIAGSTHTSGQHFKGYIDEFRVTKGVARYTGPFTPPAAAFPTSS
jgi:hypothetical protein